MKASDIKVGYIYYVDYEPVRNGEFNGVHLSVVLKMNSDRYTFVVMPLTSSANGNGVNKIILAGLPDFRQISKEKIHTRYIIKSVPSTLTASGQSKTRTAGLMFR